MTKRRWLKAAIEESRKPQVKLPWARDTDKTEAAAIAARPVRYSKEIRV